MARNYSNISPELQLSSSANSSQTEITVDGDPIVAAEFAIVVTPDATKANEEVMLVTAVVNNGNGTWTLTVTRGYDGTSAKSHNAGATVTHVVIAKDITDLAAYVEADDASTLEGQSGSYYLAWANITGKPSTFTPSSHSHDWSDITGEPVYTTRWPSWSEVTDKPSTFTPSSHSHGSSDITDFDAAVDARLDSSQTIGAAWTFNSGVTFNGSVKIRGSEALALEHEGSDPAGLGGYTTIWANSGGSLYHKNATGSAVKILTASDEGSLDAGTLDGEDGSYYLAWANITGKPSTFAPSSHSHDWSDITGEPAYTTRWPSWSEVTGKPSTFAPSSHTHPASEVDSGTFVDARISESSVQQHLDAGQDIDFDATRKGDVWVGRNTTSGTGAPSSYVTIASFGQGQNQPFQIATKYDSTHQYYIRRHSDNVGSENGAGWQPWHVIWTNGTDGAGSGLDADLLDGEQGAYFLDWNNFTNLPAYATRWPSWSEVTSKPSTFTPSSHSHDWSDITGEPVYTTRWPSWSEVTSKPSTFTPSSHSHDGMDIDGTSLWNPDGDGAVFTYSDANPTYNGDALGGTITVSADGNNTQALLVSNSFHAKHHVQAANGFYVGTAEANGTQVIDSNGKVVNAAVPEGAVTQHNSAIAPTWNNVSGKPATFAPSSHTFGSHSDVNFTSIATGHVPRWNGAEWVNVAESTLAVAWGSITGKPSSFNPDSHTHDWADITGEPAYTTRWPSWSEVTGKPSTFTPSSHSHDWSDITGEPSYTTRWPSWTEVTDKPTTFSPSSHSHTSPSEIHGVRSYDNRNTDVEPDDYGVGVRFEFRANDTDGLSDGGTYHGVMHWRSYGSGTDFSGGYPVQIAYTVNGHLWTRMGTGNTTWGSWQRLMHDGDSVAWGDLTGLPSYATRWPSWSEVTSKPSTFTPSSHTHDWADITGEPAYTTRWPTWSEVTSKPSTFTPSSHTHDWADITGEPAYTTRWPSWSEVTGKPSTFAPESHSHDWADITGEPAYTTRWPSWSEVTSKPSTVSQGEAEAGTATTDRLWTAQRVKQAIDALASGGGFEYKSETASASVVGYGVSEATGEASITLTEPSQASYIEFKSDGTKMFVLDESNGDICEYDLSVAWDVTSKSYVDKFTLRGSSTEGGVAFKSDGTRIIYSHGGTFYQRTLSTPWDVSTAGSEGSSGSIGSYSHGFRFNPDGTKVFVLRKYEYRIKSYSLSTAWDITSLNTTAVEDYYLGSTHGIPYGLDFNADGTTLWLYHDGRKLVEFSLDSAWDVSSPTEVSVRSDLGNQSTGAGRGLTFGDSGTKLYFVERTYDDVYQYTTEQNASTTLDLDLSTGTFFDVTNQTGVDFTFSNCPASSGELFEFRVHVNDLGADDWSVPGSVDWAAGSQPPVPSSGDCILRFVTLDGGTSYLGFLESVSPSSVLPVTWHWTHSDTNVATYGYAYSSNRMDGYFTLQSTSSSLVAHIRIPEGAAGVKKAILFLSSAGAGNGATIDIGTSIHDSLAAHQGGGANTTSSESTNTWNTQSGQYIIEELDVLSHFSSATGGDHVFFGIRVTNLSSNVNILGLEVEV